MFVGPFRSWVTKNPREAAVAIPTNDYQIAAQGWVPEAENPSSVQRQLELQARGMLVRLREGMSDASRIQTETEVPQKYAMVYVLREGERLDSPAPICELRRDRSECRDEVEAECRIEIPRVSSWQ